MYSDVLFSVYWYFTVQCTGTQLSADQAIGGRSPAIEALPRHHRPGSAGARLATGVVWEQRGGIEHLPQVRAGKRGGIAQLATGVGWGEGEE